MAEFVFGGPSTLRFSGVSVPKLRIPFEVGPRGAKTVEQDTPQEIAQCVYAILATQPGERTELPEFGFASQLFRQGGVDLEELRQAVEEWEPRAEILTESEFEGLVQLVKVTV